MKIACTSDWHLGKKFYGHSLTDYQEKFLKWILDFVRQEQIDLLIIAGDIFDTTSPPHESIKIFYEFLHQFEERAKSEMVVISGNHDSSNFLKIPTPLLNHKKITFFTQHDLGQSLPTLEREDCNLIFLPYFRHYDLLKNCLHNDGREMVSEESLLKTFQDLVQKSCQKDKKNLFISHHFYGHGVAAGSELALSGIERIPLDLLPKELELAYFGHLHGRQVLKKEGPLAFYTGSPYQLRFGEAMKKHLAVYQTDSKKLDWHSLPSFYSMVSLKLHGHEDLSQLQKSIQEKLASLARPVLLEVDFYDFFEEVEKKDALLTYLHQLDQVEPINLHFKKSKEEGVKEDFAPETKALDPLTLFQNFYQVKLGKTPPNEYLEIIKEVTQNTPLKTEVRSSEDQDIASY